jgi:hypothetical protein
MVGVNFQHVPLDPVYLGWNPSAAFHQAWKLALPDPLGDRDFLQKKIEECGK